MKKSTKKFTFKEKLLKKIRFIKSYIHFKVSDSIKFSRAGFSFPLLNFLERLFAKASLFTFMLQKRNSLVQEVSIKVLAVLVEVRGEPEGIVLTNLSTNIFFIFFTNKF